MTAAAGDYLALHTGLRPKSVSEKLRQLADDHCPDAGEAPGAETGSRAEPRDAALPSYRGRRFRRADRAGPSTAERSAPAVFETH